MSLALILNIDFSHSIFYYNILSKSFKVSERFSQMEDHHHLKFFDILIKFSKRDPYFLKI